MRSTRMVAVVASLATICLQASVAYADPNCTRTGAESLSTDKGSYQAGETVIVSGTGFSGSCGVVMRVTRPDGSVVTGDASNTPGSDTATTTTGGALRYDYRLNDMQGEYRVDALDTHGDILAAAEFADAKAWTFGVTPATVATGTPATLTLTATNTSSTTVAAERIACVRVELNPTIEPVGAPVVLAVSNARRWSVTRSGRTITATANLVNGGTDDAIRRLELVRLTQSVTAASSAGSPFTLTGEAFSANACGGGLEAFPVPNVDTANPAGRQPALAVVDNSAPDARDDAYEVNEDNPLVVSASSGVLANDSDADGNALNVQLVSTTSHGTLTLGAAGGFTYVPAFNFNGTDSFTYRARDPYTSTTATATITVNPVNDAPIAIDDVARTSQNVAVDIDVLANDVDFDHPTAALRVASVQDALNGTAQLLADGRTIRFTSGLDLNDANTPWGFAFTYTTTDGIAESSDAAVVEIRVSANAVPVCTGATPTVDEDGVLGLTAACTDTDPLVYSVLTAPAHGALTLDGVTLRYTPAADYNGADSFTYTASDGISSAAPATVSITVNPVNDPPTARADSAIVAEDTAAVVDVLANDSSAPDADEVLSVQAGQTTSAQGGIALCDEAACTYTPAPDFDGADSFTYTLTDGSGVTASATVNITVNPVNDAPVATDGLAATTEDAGAILIAVLADGDTAGPANESYQSLWLRSVGAPTNGTAAAEGTQVRYEAKPNFFGTDAFTYEVCDDATDAACATATVTVTIAGVDDAPVLSVASSLVKVQYSDPLPPLSIVASDVDDAGSALSLWTTGLPDGLSVAPGPGSLGAPSSDAPGVRSALLSGTPTTTTGDHVVTVYAADLAGNTGSVDVVVRVVPEDAAVTFTGALTAATATADAPSATVPLRATVRDGTAVDPADTTPGDVSHAAVRFVDRSTGETLCVAAVVTLPDDPTTGTASCSATLAAGSTVRVGSLVGGRYVRDDSSDDVTITICRPQPESFVTGRGFLTAGSGAGTYTADLGSRIPFSLNAKYVKGKSTLQGNASVSITSGRKTYQIDAALLGALATANSGGVKTASFSGGATLTDASGAVRSGLQVQLTLTDRGEPGNQDSVAIALYDGSTLLFASRWDGARAFEANVNGGNLVIR